MITLRRWLLASLVAGLAATACGSTPLRSVVPPTSASVPVALPTSVDIPSIGVHAQSLQPLGLDKNGTIEIPSLSKPEVLGYYTRGGAPCVPGPQKVSFALIGHIDGAGKKGILFNLKNLKQGDVVTIGLDNGKSCTYRVNKLDQFEKQDFPTQVVWGPVADSQIRIVSCGGPYIGAPYYYRDNVVGFGTLVR